jgi:inhibitor of cysteine peptidase
MRTRVVALSFLLVTLLAGAGCAAGSPSSPDANVDISADAFGQTNHASENVELAAGGMLTVTLGSNPTTGFSWGDTAQVADASILEQMSYELVGPEDSSVVGAGGSEVWVFKALKSGTTTVSFAYSRPWEGGEKDVWTLDLTVKVK